MNQRTLSCLLIVVFGGTIFGFGIGYVAPLETFYTYVTNCTSIADKKLCQWVGPHTIGGCVWVKRNRHHHHTAPPSPSPPSNESTTSGAPPSLFNNDARFPHFINLENVNKQQEQDGGAGDVFVSGGDDGAGTTATATNDNDNETDWGCDFAGGFNNCSLNMDHDTCASNDYCIWDETHKKCHHVSGWSASQQGIIATMMIIGAFVSSMPAGRIVSKLGLKVSLGVASVVNLLAAGLQFGAWAHPDFDIRLAIYLAGRFFCGLSVGLSTVVCPMYVGEVSLPELAPTIGVSFQVFVTAGIMLAALLGLVLRPPDDGAVKADADRFQVINAVNLALIFCQLVVSWYVVSPVDVQQYNDDGMIGAGGEGTEEDALVFSQNGTQKQQNSSSQQQQQGGGDMNETTNDVERPFICRIRYVLCALCLGGALQLSGINAVMNFVPTMAVSVGLNSPFLSNFLVMFWNFITTIVSIPLSKKLAIRWSFMGGALIAGIACFIVGIPTFPGVLDNEDARNGLIIFGIFFFIAVFEVCIGPSFYVLAQSIFPPEIRGTGCGASLAVNFVFNALINYGFPVAVQGLSGGASGNQKKGLAICFLLFGGMSIGCAAALWFLIGGKNGGGGGSGGGDDGGDGSGAVGKKGSMISNPRGGDGVGDGQRLNSSSANHAQPDTFLYGTSDQEQQVSSSPRM